MPAIFLVHGGLWEDLDAERFWGATGVRAGLAEHGLRTLAPDRLVRAPSWAAEAAHLVAALPPEPVTVIAGSHGCSAAARLALARPESVAALLLAWPATAGDPDVDASAHARLDSVGARTTEVSHLLDGQVLRGVSETDLGCLAMPVGVLPSVPEDRQHQRRTVDALLARIPHARELPGCPAPPAADFADHLPRLVGSLLGFVDDAVGC
ncbi:hypothetical protein GCM10010124_14550 [Pilimelia terevasa]|uniref:Alpha/beta hydrolase n=1 Tax=Pilimelia terevasa TaxID=53372 RepID=A0A8J3BN10_9ACTN|nr:alpha/beta hydrolase [Pilimelia terevasa]GGK23110.1 hypothetical protein GCM10010124_14550 [Pilimelia terevasa]